MSANLFYFYQFYFYQFFWGWMFGLNILRILLWTPICNSVWVPVSMCIYVCVAHISRVIETFVHLIVWDIKLLPYFIFLHERTCQILSFPSHFIFFQPLEKYTPFIIFLSLFRFNRGKSWWSPLIFIFYSKIHFTVLERCRNGTTQFFVSR